MHRALPMIIVFALVLLANPVAAEMPTVFGSSMRAGVKEGRGRGTCSTR